MNVLRVMTRPWMTQLDGDQFFRLLNIAHSFNMTTPSSNPAGRHCRPSWTLLTKVETSCDRILIAGGANVEAEWEQGPAV